MDLLHRVKVLCAERRTNLTKVTQLYNETYGTTISQQSMYRKLKNETIQYVEMEMLLNILDCRVVWDDRFKYD